MARRSNDALSGDDVMAAVGQGLDVEETEDDAATAADAAGITSPPAPPLSGKGSTAGFDDAELPIPAPLPEAAGRTTAREWIDVVCAPGFTATLYRAADLASQQLAKKDGVIFPVRGKGYVRNERDFHFDAEGHFLFGDLIVGVENTSNYLSRMAAQELEALSQLEALLATEGTVDGKLRPGQTVMMQHGSVEIEREDTVAG